MMKTALVLAALCSSAAAFAPLSTSIRSRTQLSVWIPEEDMTADQKEIKKIAEKWNQVRLMDPEQVKDLEPEWKEAYERHSAQHETDIAYMVELMEKIKKSIDPPKVQKKSKSQKKRDKWAKVQARDAYRLANPVTY